MTSSVRRRQRRAQGLVLRFLGLALLMHLAGLPLLGFLLPAPPEKAKRPRVVRLISGKSARALARRSQRRRAREEAEQQKKKLKKEEKLQGQVVDIPPSADDRPPENAEYLSEHNTRTERETRSRHASSDYKNVMNEPSRSDAEEKSSPEEQSQTLMMDFGPEQPRPLPPNKQKAGKESALEIPKLSQRDRLALRLDPDFGTLRNQRESEALDGEGQRLRLSTGDEHHKPEQGGTAPNKSLTMADLIPRVGVLARLDGGPTNDHLEGLEEGEGTFLNSREFKYASFFNRMKRGVSQHWHPLREYRRRDPTGHIYGQRPRRTILNIKLKADGSLEAVQVTQSSGVDFLDREAIAAFQKAEPFPNPPKGLISDTGYISFPFGFHLEFSRGFRSPF